MTDDKWPGECSNHEHSPGHIYARSVQIMYTHPVTLMLKFGISIRSATNRLFFRILVALFADFKPVITGLLKCGTNLDECGTNLTKSGTTFDKCGTNFDECGTNLSKSGTTFDKCGTNVDKCGTNLSKSGITFDKCGTNVDKCGSTFSKNRSTWHKKGSIPGECPVHVHSPGHNDIIVEIYKSFICRN